MIQLYGFQVYVQTDSGRWISDVARVFSTSVDLAMYALEESLEKDTQITSLKNLG